MKRAIAFEREAKKKRSKFSMKEKKEKERERGKRSRAQRNGALNIARSRASHSFSVFIVDIIIAQSPLSLSRARPLSRRKENPLKRSNLYTHITHTRTHKKILTSVARTNYPCLRRATRALARTCGRRNRNSARAPVSSRTFATTSLSSLLY